MGVIKGDTRSLDNGSCKGTLAGAKQTCLSCHLILTGIATV